jgi:hypothetical protein
VLDHQESTRLQYGRVGRAQTPGWAAERVLVLRQRMPQGRLRQARRGGLSFALPIGYIGGSDGESRLDPDEQVQTVVRLVLRKFTELDTRHGVLRDLADQQIQLGIRVREGPGKGALVWRRPNRRRCRTCSSTRAPACSSWEPYEANLAHLEAHRVRVASRGAVRAGPALPAGLVVCARWGTRGLVRYRGAPARHRYGCSRRATNYWRKPTIALRVSSHACSPEQRARRPPARSRPPGAVDGADHQCCRPQGDPASGR